REIPEADARDLDGDLMRSALAHHGALIVRGLLDSATCARIRADIDEAFEAADQAREQRLSAIDPWYADFPIDGEFTPLDPVATIFLRSAGGVYAPHSPRAFLEYRRAL